MTRGPGTLARLLTALRALPRLECLELEATACGRGGGRSWRGGWPPNLTMGGNAPPPRVSLALGLNDLTSSAAIGLLQRALGPVLPPRNVAELNVSLSFNPVGALGLLSGLVVPTDPGAPGWSGLRQLTLAAEHVGRLAPPSTDRACRSLHGLLRSAAGVERLVVDVRGSPLHAALPAVAFATACRSLRLDLGGRETVWPPGFARRIGRALRELGALTDLVRGGTGGGGTREFAKKK